MFEHAETVVLPVYPEIAALKAVHALLDYLNETGLGRREVDRSSSTTCSPARSSSSGTSRARSGTKIDAELPYDPFLYLKAVNEGIPIVRGAPRTPPAERLLRLATVVFGEGKITAPGAIAGVGDGAAPARDEKKGGLFGGLRRR